MINIENKADIVSIFEDEENNLQYNGKQLIKLNKEYKIPPRTRVELETGLHITLTDAVDECIVGEYILDEESPLYVVCETYSCEWEDYPISIAIYNSSKKEYTIKEGEAIAFIGQYHICNCINDNPTFDTMGERLGASIVYNDGDIKIVNYSNKQYHFEEVTEPDGSRYIKITESKE